MVTTGPVKPRHGIEKNITLSLPRTNSNAAGILMSFSRDDLENMTRGHVVSSAEGVVEQKYILIPSLSEVYSASSNSVFVEVTSNSFGREEFEVTSTKTKVVLSSWPLWKTNSDEGGPLRDRVDGKEA